MSPKATTQVGTILAFDPGETTGWVCLRNGKVAGGSFPLWSEVERLITKADPSVVVVEDFLLYPQALKHLKWNRVLTVRVIGVIEFLCQKNNIPCKFQLPKERIAIEAKQIRGFDIHATQALRHALLYASNAGDPTYDSFQTRKRAKNNYRRDDGLEPGDHELTRPRLRRSKVSR